MVALPLEPRKAGEAASAARSSTHKPTTKKTRVPRSAVTVLIAPLIAPLCRQDAVSDRDLPGFSHSSLGASSLLPRSTALLGLSAVWGRLPAVARICPQTAEANCGVVQAFRTEPVGETRISSMTFPSGP